MMGPAELKRALLLANVYPPDDIIGAARPARFVRYLPEFGYWPHVITGTPQLAGARDVLYAPYRPGKLEKYLSLLFFPHDDRMSWALSAATAATELLTTSPFTVLFSTSPPLSGHLAALRLKQLFGLKWVADFRDPMRGNFIHRPLRAELPVLWIEKLLFRHADILIANTDAAACFWSRIYPAYQKKIRVIYNGFDPEAPLQRPAPIPRRPYRLLLHAGSLYTSAAHPSEFLSCLLRLIGNGVLLSRSIRLRMIGDIEHERLFRRIPAVRELTARGVLEYFPRAIPASEARQAMAQADALLLLDRFGVNGILQLPAKVFEYIQLGRPIVAYTGAGSPVEQVLSISGVRHVCIYRDDPPERQDRKLLEFLNLPTDPLEASDAYRHKFGAYEQSRALADIFDSL